MEAASGATLVTTLAVAAFVAAAPVIYERWKRARSEPSPDEHRSIDLLSPEPGEDAGESARGLLSATRALLLLAIWIVLMVIVEMIALSAADPGRLDDQASAISLAERQRLLAERIGRLSVAMSSAPADPSLAAEMLETSTELRRDSQILFGDGTAEGAQITAFSQATIDLPDEMDLLDRVDSLVEVAGAVAETSTSVESGTTLEELDSLYEPVAASFASLVDSMQRDHTEAVGEIRGWERIVFIADVVTLLSVGLLVLIPISRRLRRGVSSLLAARDRLEAREEHLRRLIEHIPDGVFIVDETSRLVRINEESERMLQHDRSDLLGRKLTAFFQSEDGTDLEPLATSSPSSVPFDGLRATAIRADGSRFPAELAMSPISYENGYASIVTVRDVTGQRRAQAELQRLSDRLTQSNRDLDEFASVAAHDLQEPLRKILAFGDHLRLATQDDLDEQALGDLDRMIGAAGRMRDLINDLLEYSRISYKAQPFEPVDLDVVARQAIADLSDLVDRTGGVVELVDLPTVEAEPTQMHQVFVNLISNGLKYQPEGAQPRVGVTAEEAGESPSGVKSYRITFSDNGIGFEPEYAKRIFGPFERLHGRGKYSGTGIGLAICQKIVDRHGGSIQADGRPGEGATFTVTLPEYQSRELS